MSPIMPSQPPGWSIDVTIANGIKKIIKPTLKYLDTSKTIPVRQADKITIFPAHWTGFGLKRSLNLTLFTHLIFLF